ncbi:MAG: glycosyltransferase family 4 protein [Candidatus Bathyarchaeia archaeon]
MRICYVMMSTVRTGGTKVIFEFASRLAKKGHVVDVVTVRYRNDPDCQSHTWFKFPENVRVHYAPFNLFAAAANRYLKKIGLPRYTIRYANRLAREIPESDIVVATYCMTAFAVTHAGIGTGVYYTQHYAPLVLENRGMKKIAEGTYSLPLRKIANCSWLKSKLEGYNDPITVIYPAIDQEIFRPIPTKRVDDEFRVVALGKTIPWKGLRDLFDATLLVRREIPRLKLILYGNEPTISAPVPFEYLARIEDEELAELYASADAVVTPSWYESFPLPPLEAMACGAPVICTPVGTEDYAVNRKNCLIVSPRNPKELASAILALRNDPDLSREIREEGILTAAKFRWEDSVNQMESFFKSLP